MANLKTGLYALLIAATASVGCSRLLTESKNNTSIDSLETITMQSPFISMGRNYALDSNPSKFGFVLISHDTPYSDRFRDVYMNEHGWSIIEGMEQEGDLEKLYDMYSNGMNQFASEYVRLNLKKDQTIRFIGKGAPREILVDYGPALIGEYELWITSADLKDIAIKKEKFYLEKYTLRTTLVRDRKKIYAFTMLFQQINRSLDFQAESFYDDVLGFRPLK